MHPVISQYFASYGVFLLFLYRTPMDIVTYRYKTKEALRQQETTSPRCSAAPCCSQSQRSAVFWRKWQACLGCYLATCRQQPAPEFACRSLSFRPPRLKKVSPDWVDMSAGGQATSSREIPAVRRVAIHDSAHMPQDYSTTPGGTVFSTTPGGDLCCRWLAKASGDNSEEDSTRV